MNLTAKVLTNISSEESTDFGELCRGLGDDAPVRGDRQGWSEIFQIIDSLEQQGLIEVERSGSRFESAQLTDLGVERAREALRGG